ncbi:PREDICTED: solute carrier family 35 member F5-like [Priapulus caudatus]|uniref:Solute carrier family 35 member F5 n=1 Tax=Priapulus caudatus TaxID=37621 RepID=A0ABM1EP29_PRICU|nr:PREDICTED: solute carrier family 35 member F5-like [Priapulus caudatus]XP_014673950.1 PREDICTED: solute carrier family 35 member F5-like [Priapulus caudatus]
MFGVSLNLSRPQRLLLGIFVLFLVVVIWVASAELTQYIFKEQGFSKPYFTTYFKTSLFMLYLTGFVFWMPWRQQCRSAAPGVVEQALIADDVATAESDQLISDPQFVPVRFSDSEIERASGTESDDSNMSLPRAVRFSKVKEVRQLSESQGEEANLARLSYSASVRAEELIKRAANKLTIRQVAKFALMFCFVWFAANCAYQEAIADTQPGVVNVLASTSGLFTLVLAAIFPSAAADKFSLSKFVAVACSVGGVIVVSLSDLQLDGNVPTGAIWALVSAILYSVYLVLLKKKAENEERLDIAMFFGFVGLFNFALLWPGFLALHYSGRERFEWPTRQQWLYLCVNGIIGTVLSEFLWLWGCFLTSSLVATLSLSLAIPATILTDVFMNRVDYSWQFFAGSVPVFVSFICVAVLSHYETWDPILVAVRKLTHCVCRRPAHKLTTRMRELDDEQRESLIGTNSHKS